MIPLRERILSAVLASGCLAILVTAALLHPDGAGHGTHRQLGMPECGFLTVTGRPCMTCGMTTSFTHAAHADFLGALRAQPMGLVGVLLVASTFWVALHSAAFGSHSLRLAGRLLRPRVLWPFAGLCALAWGYKILTWQG